jgi:hypothetical protein
MMRPLHGIIAALILSAAGLAAAEQDVYASAAVGSRWLNVPGNARVAALGGAFAARGAEPGAVESNPASLAGMPGWQALFTHDAWIEGMSVERLQGAMHLGCWGTAGLSLDYLSLGAVERFQLDSSNQPQSLGTTQLSSWAVSASYAYDFGATALGLNLRTLGENLATQSGYAFQGDLGARYTHPTGIRAGFSVRNLSLDFSPAQRPLSLRGGIGYTVTGERPLALDINTDYQTQDGEGASLRLAAEWAAARSFLIRGGYIVASENSPHGPTVGAGWISPWGEIDYALYDAGEIGFSHLFTLRVLGWQGS